MCSDWSLSSLRVSFEIDVNTCFFSLNIFCYSRRPRKMNTQFKPSVLVYLSSKFSFFPTYLIDVLNYHKSSSGNCLFSLTFYFQETKIDHSFFIMIIIRLFLISLYISCNINSFSSTCLLVKIILLHFSLRLVTRTSKRSLTLTYAPLSKSQYPAKKS